MVLSEITVYMFFDITNEGEMLYKLFYHYILTMLESREYEYIHSSVVESTPAKYTSVTELVSGPSW